MHPFYLSLLDLYCRVHVLAPRSRAKNEGAVGIGKAIAVRGADIDHGGQNELGHISMEGNCLAPFPCNCPI